MHVFADLEKTSNVLSTNGRTKLRPRRQDSTSDGMA